MSRRLRELTEDISIKDSYHPKELLDLLGVNEDDKYTSICIFSNNQQG